MDFCWEEGKEGGLRSWALGFFFLLMVVKMEADPEGVGGGHAFFEDCCALWGKDVKVGEFIDDIEGVGL